jgi:tRNA pseudouridine55 synthase
VSKKQTYFQKHLQQLENEGVSKQRMPAVTITDEERKVFEEGKVILIDKPLHWTSFDVVRKIRGAIRIKKVGHAGTLDPLATGLLIICTGKFTKKINEYMSQEKEYTGTITLGAVTPTYDLESKPQDFRNAENITIEMINAAAKNFKGDILQRPPVYAAIKQKGTPLYELARRGEDVDLQPRPVNISLFDVTMDSPGIVGFRIACSTGTYIRSIAHDLGQALGCGGYLSSLRRTRIGSFEVKDADENSRWGLSAD